MKYREIVGLRRVVRNMLSWGMLATWIVTAVATRIALGFSWEICLLFGAVTVVTGPTVIVPMLRTVRPTAPVANILRWEGIVIDPIGASLAVLVYNFIVSGSGEEAIGHTLFTFGAIITVGLFLGSFGGYCFGTMLRRRWIPEYLHKVAALALVVAFFAASNALQHESGLVTVTVMGVWLANMEGVNIDEILDFKESLSILLISLLFIFLAARMRFEDFQSLGWAAVFVLLAIQFLARPLNILISSMNSDLSWPERHILAWIAPRGIVVAAVSALFALKLEPLGHAEAHFLVPLTFMVIIGTVLLQSATARPIARWLGAAEPDPLGFLLIGANPVARAIARALASKGFHVLLAEANWDNIAKAKMDGLDTYYGNPISEHADRHLDLVGIGRMLALSHHEKMNHLAAMNYRMELSENEVYVLQSKDETSVSSKFRMPASRRGRILFGAGITYAMLSSMLSQGGEVRATKLSQTFTFEQYISKSGGKLVPLFAIDSKDRIHLFTADDQVKPAAGWTVIGMHPPKSPEPNAT